MRYNRNSKIMSKNLKIFLIFILANTAVSAFLLNQDSKQFNEVSLAQAVSSIENSIKVVEDPETPLPDIQVRIIDNPNDYLPAVLNENNFEYNSQSPQKKYTQEVIDPIARPDGTVRYTGPVAHIFFHSLIVYPEKAAKDYGNSSGYDDYMITKDQFKIILNQLYSNNYILIDSSILYSIRDDGSVAKQNLYLPAGKKPLVISLDDLSYYDYMKNGGFASKLVLQNGVVKTEVMTPTGKTEVSNDGDVVPILDDFVRSHPDFSWQGAKGIIALTGYEGILGYDTNEEGTRGEQQRSLVKPIIEKLKNTGWTFASHSYSHGSSFRKGTISESGLAYDISRWRREVGSLVGNTNVFIGPFGQVFKEGDPRRRQLINAGFPIMHGVGMNHYLAYFRDHVAMDRIDIDGFRIRNNPNKLRTNLGIDVSKL